MKNNIFELMGKLDENYNKILNENRQQLKNGIPYESLSEEDQKIFNDVFDNPKLRGANLYGVEGNHIRTKEIKDWDKPDGQRLKRDIKEKVQKFNQHSNNYNIVLDDFVDWELEPGERTFDAYYTFTFVPKNIMEI
jgi:hypothetical protein